jgi:hypothetical protein
MEIVQSVWPEKILSRSAAMNCCARSNTNSARPGAILTLMPMRITARSSVRYGSVAQRGDGPIGTSTAFAAWNAAVYVAQVEDDRLDEVTQSGRYLDATREVLRKHNGSGFTMIYVISRRRD